MSRFQRTSGQRCKVSWAGGPRGVFQNVTAAQVTLFAVGSQANVDDLTLVRIRGELLVQISNASAVNSGFQWAFGMCVVSENAFGIGATAIPAPFTDIAWDGWMVHLQGSNFYDTLDLTANLADTVRVVIDSKAMRKTHATDVLCALLETHDEIGTASLDAHLVSRTLSKLP